MSAEAARIISKISGRKQISGFQPMLGTVESLSPLTIKFDDVGFEVSTGLLINSLFLEQKKDDDIPSSAMNVSDVKIDFKSSFTIGDRVIGVAIGGTHYVVLCKVVSV